MVNAAFEKMPLITLKKSDILKYDLFSDSESNHVALTFISEP